MVSNLLLSGWYLVFFFSSRRRHTICSRDWSSDVCSSDLQHAVRLMQHQHRSLGYCLQIVVGDHQRDFDHAVGVRIQAGHLHVYPDKMILVLCHNSSAKFERQGSYCVISALLEQLEMNRSAGFPPVLERPAK